VVLPIDLQTVVGQLNSAGRIQQQQQTAGMDVQNAQMIKDSRRLKEMDEQVDDAKRVDSDEVKDSTKKNTGGRGSESQHKEEEEEGTPPPPNQGRIIDLEG
jgi:hypothetical protein